MTDTEVYDFLEHRGVKGMKWGVRKARDTSGKTQRTPEQEAKRKQVKKDIILASGLVAGTVAVGVLLHHTGAKKTSSIPKAQISDNVKNFTNLFGGIKMSDIPKATPKVKVTPKQSKDLKDFNTKMARIYKDANEGLRKQDVAMSIPHPDRWYLPDWN